MYCTANLLNRINSQKQKKKLTNTHTDKHIHKQIQRHTHTHEQVMDTLKKLLATIQNYYLLNVVSIRNQE